MLAQNLVLVRVVGADALVNDRRSAALGVVNATDLFPAEISIGIGDGQQAVPIDAGVDAIKAGDAPKAARALIAVAGQ